MGRFAIHKDSINLIYCQYCHKNKPCQTFDHHQRNCMVKKEVEEAKKQAKVKRSTEIKYLKLKADIHKIGMKMGTKVTLVSMVDGRTVDVGIGVLAQQSNKVRQMLSPYLFGKKIPMSCDYYLLSSIATYCVIFDFAYKPDEDDHEGHALESRFISSFLSRDDPSIFKIACVAEDMEMGGILDLCLGYLNAITMNMTRGEMKSMFKLKRKLKPVQMAVLDKIIPGNF